MQNYFKGRPSYTQHFGLWLNRDRVLNRRARSVEIGCSIAMGTGQPTEAYFGAIADNEEQAKYMYAMHMAARSSK
jgi:hypothetical protein